MYIVISFYKSSYIINIEYIYLEYIEYEVIFIYNSYL